ncbi:MAG: thioredoxin family protein [Chloroflexota bacterium]|nr:thioredoxin family protein [Anaerolineales bacterium]
MIIERVLLTGVFAILGILVFTVMRQTHVRRLNRAGQQGQAKETAVFGQPTLLYFRSDGCAVCPTQSRYLDQLAERWHGRITIRKIDADAEPETAVQFGIFTLPTTIVMDSKGTVRQINYGLTHPHKLAQQLEAL